MAQERPAAARRKKPTIWDGAVALCLVLAAGLLFWLMRPGSAGAGLQAVVTVDGETVAVLPLEGEEIRVYAPECSYPLILEYSAAGVRAVESGCPGRDCMAAGLVSRAGGQIVCLPNRLVVTVRSQEPADLDAILQ